MLISVVTNYSKIPQIVTIFITRSGYHPTCPTAASNFTRNTLVQYRGPVIPFHGQAEDQRSLPKFKCPSVLSTFLSSFHIIHIVVATPLTTSFPLSQNLKSPQQSSESFCLLSRTGNRNHHPRTPLAPYS